MIALPSIRMIGIGLAAAGALAAGSVLWTLRAENGRLQQRLEQAGATSGKLAADLGAARAAIDTQTGQIHTLLAFSQQQAADMTALAQRLDTIRTDANRRALTLETTTHEDPTAQAWGDVPLPAAVAGVLDYTTTRPGIADGATVPAGHAVPAADHPAVHQPQPGAQPDRESGGA